VNDATRPVLVGAAQLIQRDVEPQQALEPLAMLERIAREAADDAGAGARVLGELDSVGIVDVVGWRPPNAPGMLAELLGARPAREYVTAIGGEMPLTLVNHVAREIASGRSRVALVAGANAFHTLRSAQKRGLSLDWKTGGSGTPEMIGVNRRGSSEEEGAYGLRMPPDIYPLFENALRARRGLDLDTHRRRMGELMSRFSRVAASNPYAWFPTERKPEEIVAASPGNRMIAYPYTKYLNAVLETDQAAGVLLMSAEAARAFGVSEARKVYWWGGADSEEEAWYASERPDLASSPALLDAVAGALAEAGVGADRLDQIDFYSCFPVAVEMACHMLGLEEDDPRGLTVTGGLPYAGGPGNNYTLHSLATMVQRLRERPGATGLVTGNGWYLTKHSAGVYASAPRDGARGGPPPATSTPRAAAPPARDATGRGTVEAYTVLFDRDGGPARGIVLGRLEDGRRFLANTPEDRSLLEAFVAREGVGTRGSVGSRDGRRLFDPA
jgi:acetyl-CoA C-acetyltransferase